MNCSKPTDVPETVMLTLTERCNLNCVYCYEHNKCAEDMPLDTALTIINVAFQRHPGRDLYIHFHGGEPLLAFSRVKEICYSVWQKEQARPYLFFASTNGTKVHGEVKEWFRKHKDWFVLGLSLDGTPEMHNRNRNNSFENIDVDFFKDTWPSQPVKMTVGRETLPNLARGVIYMHERGFRVAGGLAQGINWQKEDYTIYADEMLKLANYYLEHPEIEPSQLFDTGLHMLTPFSLRGDVRWCGAGKYMSCFDMKGTGYPCQVFMPSVNEAEDGGKERRRKAQALLNDASAEIVSPACKKCVIASICPTCYGMNYINRGSLTDKGADNCTFNLIRAVVSSTLMSGMLQEREKYPLVRDIGFNKLYSLIRAIEDIDKYIPEAALMARIQGKPSTLGL